MRYSIGEFSRITSLSIKTLRLYHEKDLLIPADIDTFTGYRYYDNANYECARTIRILRQYDFSLADIRSILDDCQDETDMLKYLEEKLSDIQDKINRYNDISRSIRTIIKNERESVMKNNRAFEIEEKELATILVAGHRMKGKYSDIGKGFALLGKTLGRHINGKAMALYYDGEYKEADADFEACFPVRKGTDNNQISVRELQGSKAVTLIHKGAYETLGDSYKKLYGYVRENKLTVKLPTREIYLKGPGMIMKGNPQNYLTEIQLLLDE